MVLLAAVLAAAPSQQFTWTVSSANGAAVLTQTALPDDACALKCEVKGKVTWSEQSCLGRVTDFTFPAGDCSRVLMLLEYPLRASTTEKTVAAVSLSATGTPVVVKTTVYVLGELADVARLRGGEGKRVRWLAGVAGEPGARPRSNADGSGIEFGTTDGATRAVRFSDELALSRVSAAPNGAPGTAESGLYQYTGADGSTHVVAGLAQVPSAYRKTATRVAAEIDTVESVKKPAPPPRRDPPPDFSGEAEWKKQWLARQPPAAPPPADPPPRFDPPPERQGGGSGAPRGAIFGLPGPAGDAVLLQEQMRRGGNHLPNSTQPPAAPPKPPASPYVPPPSPYTPPPSPYTPPPSPYAPPPQRN